MTDAPEVYVSDCCGGMFIPGHGPDDIHGATEGEELVLEGPGHPPEERDHSGVSFEIYVVGEREAQVYDAIRAGECPACGQAVPGLTRLDERV